MHRLDRKKGRFTLKGEGNEYRTVLNAWQNMIGTTALYFRFDRERSTINDVYDEGSGAAGKVFHPPFVLPAIHAVRHEGSAHLEHEGMYFNDELHLTCSYDQLVRGGMPELDVKTQRYLMDRLVYDDIVFRVTNIQVLGQIQDRDLVVGIEATQVKPDELVTDAQFARWTVS